MVLRDLPRSIPGIDTIEVQVVDDGSTDRTVAVARELGVTHIIGFKKNRGLAAAFRAGSENALSNQADILVNTDGDNQYSGHDIAKLVQPIIMGKADIVIGCRPIDDHPEFSRVKKILQKLGSWVLRKVSKTTVRDATSGFRAYSRNSLLHLNIYSDFTYCLETLIQAGLSNMVIDSVDIAVNPKTRKSRLFRNIPQYIFRSVKTIAAIFIVYRANVIFGLSALLTLLASCAMAARYIFLTTFEGAPAATFWPTLILAGILLVIAFQLYLAGLLASLQAANRKLNEEVVYRLRTMQLPASPPHKD